MYVEGEEGVTEGRRDWGKAVNGVEGETVTGVEDRTDETGLRGVERGMEGGVGAVIEAFFRIDRGAADVVVTPLLPPSDEVEGREENEVLGVEC